MKKKATIRDVARLANVSVATVSRILKSQARCLWRDTSEGIKCYDELGYARSMQWQQR